MAQSHRIAGQDDEAHVELNCMAPPPTEPCHHLIRLHRSGSLAWTWPPPSRTPRRLAPSPSGVLCRSVQNLCLSDLVKGAAQAHWCVEEDLRRPTCVVYS